MENFISTPMVFVGDKSKAAEFLNEAKQAGYDSAFIVSFENGKRLNWKKL